MTARDRIAGLRELQAKADAGRWCAELSHEALAALPALLDIAEAAMDESGHDGRGCGCPLCAALAKLEGK